MSITAHQTDRTAHLLELMTRGDDAFNARDSKAVKALHHPEMVAYITGRAEPVYGRDAHAAEMAQMLEMFPDTHVHTPYPIQFGGEDWITVITRVTGTFMGEMLLPDGTTVPPTGRAFDVTMGQTSRWAGDQLIEIAAFWDAREQARQLGLG